MRRVVTSSKVEEERKKHERKNSMTSSRSSSQNGSVHTLRNSEQESQNRRIVPEADQTEVSHRSLNRSLTQVGDGMDSIHDIMHKAAIHDIMHKAAVHTDIFTDGKSYDLSLVDKISYGLENKMARSEWQKFYILLYIVIIIWGVFTVLWKYTSGGDDEIRGETAGSAAGIAFYLTWGPKVKYENIFIYT